MILICTKKFTWIYFECIWFYWQKLYNYYYYYCYHYFLVGPNSNLSPQARKFSRPGLPSISPLHVRVTVCSANVLNKLTSKDSSVTMVERCKQAQTLAWPQAAGPLVITTSTARSTEMMYSLGWVALWLVDGRELKICERRNDIWSNHGRVLMRSRTN